MIRTKPKTISLVRLKFNTNNNLSMCNMFMNMQNMRLADITTNYRVETKAYEYMYSKSSLVHEIKNEALQNRTKILTKI